jgi:hypothetical protein
MDVTINPRLLEQFGIDAQGQQQAPAGAGQAG